MSKLLLPKAVSYPHDSVRRLAQCLAENGRRWVEEKYDWRTVYRKLDEVYANLAK